MNRSVKTSPERRTYEHAYVQTMFDSIARRYDLLNHVLSSGIDIWWRKQAMHLLRPYHPESILDVATGTADFAIAAARLHPRSITGMDLSESMLAVAKIKIQKKHLAHLIALRQGTAESLPFADETFDAVLSAFGVRNFSSLEQGMAESFRVLHNGGVLVILEFSHPRSFPIRQLYAWYSKVLLPRIGRFISANRSAYQYLPDTVAAFPDGEHFCTILRNAGFSNTRWIPLTFGIVTVYIAEKHIPIPHG